MSSSFHRKSLCDFGSSLRVRSRNLHIALFNLPLQDLQPTNLGAGLPRRNTCVEDVVHFLKREPLCLVGHEEHVNECCAVDYQELAMRVPLGWS